jgi:hypothetical protein
MSCDDAAQAVQEALSGATSPIELGRRLPLAVHQHLERCLECRDAAQDMVALERLLRTPLADVPPPDLTASVMRAVRGLSAVPSLASPQPLSVPQGRRRLPVWAAAVVAGAAAALFDYAAAAAGLSVGTPWGAAVSEEWAAFVTAWNDTLVWLLASVPPTWTAAPQASGANPWAVVLGCAILMAISICTLRWDGGTRRNA